ncbi:uncharacterized protein LOC113520625 [Galleria mellonella]|uniref:Uncharacterized protein LOC113520625 n=1 Tax=Galleria mellonella TaxID=7137 RepID=A0A6J1WZE6_GALME|nr:uncharacterized protein LOC113520625 [Galleria mellonella]
MLDGWYCRSIANMQASEAASVSNSAPTETTHARESQNYSSDSSSEPDPEPNYRAQYIALKKKLKYLIYENECFQDALRCGQKRLLKVSRDRSFLLDRLLQYEKHESTTSESEDTESSDDTDYNRHDNTKRKKNLDVSVTHHHISTPSALTKGPNAMKRKRAVVPKKPHNTSHLHQSSGAILSKASPSLSFGLSASDGHMTPEEVERHLQSRQSYLELLPERAPPTVPTEMFSNDPSLDSESNDVLENSPNVDEWFD